jgi:MoxR-like ATPase
MPFKSQAQRRKFAQLLVEGKISPETYEEWNRETGGTRLPEHVTKKAKSTSSRKRTKQTKRTRRTKATKRAKR